MKTNWSGDHSHRCGSDCIKSDFTMSRFRFKQLR
jgi:hypothetical protein